jgi:hydrogenase nickel incorporation protein HypB
MGMSDTDIVMECATRQSEADSEVARKNRERLNCAGVFAVNVAGGLGCGKSALLGATARRLAGDRQVGIVSADPDGVPGVSPGARAVHVQPGFGRVLAARDLRSALDRLDLSGVELLLVENVGSFAGPDAIDLGEHARAAIFSVAAGHRIPSEHPGLVRWADAVVLNKLDLRTGFDLRAFRAAIGRLNAGAAYFEMSTQSGHGVDAWVGWLTDRSRHAK